MREIRDLEFGQFVLANDLSEVLRHVFLDNAGFRKVVGAVRPRDVQQSYDIIVLEMLKKLDFS
jgi:hypothetical protein